MKLKLKQLEALVYADLFNWPLTAKELNLPGDRYFFLPGRQKLVSLRKKKEKYSLEKEKIARQKAQILQKIPTIEAIFLTGSVAVGNASQDADIDLMIVTAPNRLWLTRLIVFSFLKLQRQLKTPICPNIFLDVNHLEVFDKNIYTAHEVLQAKCLFDKKETYRKWLKENKWVKEFLPDGYKNLYKTGHQTPPASKRSNPIIGLVELAAFVVQYLYMKPKMTNEKIGRTRAFFHPQNLSQTIPQKYRQRLLKYTGK